MNQPTDPLARTARMINAALDILEAPRLCAECGKRTGTMLSPYRDVCPTDRGDEIREGVEYVCSECSEEEEDAKAELQSFLEEYDLPDMDDEEISTTQEFLTGGW
jgi:hypothetical protein